MRGLGSEPDIQSQYIDLEDGLLEQRLHRGVPPEAHGHGIESRALGHDGQSTQRRKQGNDYCSNHPRVLPDAH